MIQTLVSAATEATIYLRNFFEELKGVHSIVGSLRDTLARLSNVLEAFPANNKIDEGLRVALSELSSLAQECSQDADRRRVSGRGQARITMTAGQLIALTKLDERITEELIPLYPEYADKRLPPVILEKSPDYMTRIHTANAFNSSLNNNLYSSSQPRHTSHSLHPSTAASNSIYSNSNNNNNNNNSNNKPKKIKSQTKIKVTKRTNPYLGEMTKQSHHIRSPSEFSRKLVTLCGRCSLQDVDSKSFVDLCFSQESIEWKAFCDILVPYFTKYWGNSHDCCSPVLEQMKQTLTTDDNDNNSGMVEKQNFQKFTHEKSILRIFNDMALDYLLGEWIRDTQGSIIANVTSTIETLVQKYSGISFCNFFNESSSRCPDLVQLSARLLVKSLQNMGSTNAVSSLALAVQGLEILTRNEYHVFLLLESGIMPYAIEAARKLKDIATSVSANTPYFPASLKMLSNICATEIGTFALLRADVHTWVASAFPSGSTLFSVDAVVAGITFFSHFHKYVQKSNLLLEKGVIAVVTTAISKFNTEQTVVAACHELISLMKSEDLHNFGASGAVADLCGALKNWQEDSDYVLLGKQLSLLAVMCTNEQNAQQIAGGLNMIPTIIQFLGSTKYKSHPDVLLHLFGLVGVLLRYNAPAKSFEQAGGLGMLSTCARNAPYSEIYTAYYCILSSCSPSVLMTNVSSQFNILNESFGRIKLDSEAVVYLLCTLSLFAVSYDADIGSIDAHKVGNLALESMKLHPSNCLIQQEACHVISTWAFRLRRGVQGEASGNFPPALLPYMASLLSTMNSWSNDESVWGESLFAISILLHRELPTTIPSDGNKIEFMQIFKMLSTILRKLPQSRIVFAGVSELLYKICKIAEFSQQDMIKIGCDDTFLETVLWAIENSSTVNVCLHFLQVLRILFHVKGMGDSATWCNSTTSAVVNVMRKFGPANSKLSRTGCYILHKITSINASYGTSGMVEVALAALRHHSSTWDIPFRAGTLLLSITISVPSMRSVIAQQSGLPQLWSARKYFEISEPNEKGFEKATTLLHHSIASSSPASSQSNGSGDSGESDFYYSTVYTQENFGASKHPHVIDVVFQKSEQLLDSIIKILQGVKLEGWYVRSAIPRAKLTSTKQLFKVPAWEQPLALLECFPNGSQNGTIILVITSGLWYQNSGGYTVSPFSERLDAFLTWADLTNSKIGVTDGTLVTVGQASVEVGRTLSAPVLTLFTELQRFFQKNTLWDGLTEKGTASENREIKTISLRSYEWVESIRSSWQDATVEEDYVDRLKVRKEGTENSKTEEVRIEETRQSPTSPHPILAGATIEVHKSPFWFPARVIQINSDPGIVNVSYVATSSPISADVPLGDCIWVSDPVPKFSLEEPTVSPTLPIKPNAKSTKQSHTTPNTTRKNLSPVKRRAETSKVDRRSLDLTVRRSISPVKKLLVEDEKAEALENSPDKSKKAEAPPSKWCDVDQSRVAVVTCAACNLKLCDQCDKKLHQNPSTRSHARKPYKFSASKFKCANDEENEAGLYCKGCEMYFCLECDIYLHKSTHKKGHERIIL